VALKNVVVFFGCLIRISLLVSSLLCLHKCERQFLKAKFKFGGLFFVRRIVLFALFETKDAAASVWQEKKTAFFVFESNHEFEWRLVLLF
jgi:hypothetical protein